MKRKTADELWASKGAIIQVGRLDAHISGRFALKPRNYKNAPQYPSVKRFKTETLDVAGLKKLRAFLEEQRIDHIIMSKHAAKSFPPRYDAAEAQEIMFEEPA